MNRRLASLSLLAGLALAPATALASLGLAFAFGPSADITAVGDTVFQDGTMRLTTDADQAGAMWYNYKQLVAQGFVTTFQFRLEPGFTTNVRGDGFAFVIQDSPSGTAAIGYGGSGLGYGAGFDNEGNFHEITRSLAIEIDTFAFHDPQDPQSEMAATHVSVQTNGQNPNSESDSSSIASANLDDLGIVLADYQSHTCSIQYTPLVGETPAHIDVYIDNTFILSVNYDLGNPDGDIETDDGIHDQDGAAYVGFTAGTGLADSTHIISAWALDDNTTQYGTTDGCASPHWNLWSWGGTGSVGPGSSMGASALVIGTRALNYRWYKNNVEITDNDGGRIQGLGTDTLNILDVTYADFDYYRMDAENACGLMTGLEVYLGVCFADLDDGTGSGIPDGGVDINDLLFFLDMFEQGDPRGDRDDGNGWGFRDGGVDINDLIFFLTKFEAGC